VPRKTAASPAGGPGISDNWKGILWILASLPCFQAMNVMLRHVAGDLPPIEVMFFRNLFGFAILLPGLIRTTDFVRTRVLGLNVIRGISHVSGMVLWVYALTLIPLATANALMFSSPLFVAVGAIVFMRERAGIHRWSAIVLGFLGVIVIFRPGEEAASIGALLVIAAAVFLGVSKLLTKVITRTDSTMAAVFYLNLVMAAAALIPSIMVWKTPTLVHLGWFLALGVVGTLAHFTMTRAVLHAELTALQPFEFVALIWAALFGFFLYAEVPTMHVFVGGAIIVGAATYIAHREARRRANRDS
jgi:drug/metabolite transporter (DMT)-like permease